MLCFSDACFTVVDSHSSIKRSFCDDVKERKNFILSFFFPFLSYWSEKSRAPSPRSNDGTTRTTTTRGSGTSMGGTYSIGIIAICSIIIITILFVTFTSYRHISNVEKQLRTPERNEVLQAEMDPEEEEEEEVVVVVKNPKIGDIIASREIARVKSQRNSPKTSPVKRSPTIRREDD